MCTGVSGLTHKQGERVSSALSPYSHAHNFLNKGIFDHRLNYNDSYMYCIKPHAKKPNNTKVL